MSSIRINNAENYSKPLMTEATIPLSYSISLTAFKLQWSTNSNCLESMEWNCSSHSQMETINDRDKPGVPFSKHHNHHRILCQLVTGHYLLGMRATVQKKESRQQSLRCITLVVKSSLLQKIYLANRNCL